MLHQTRHTLLWISSAILYVLLLCRVGTGQTTYYIDGGQSIGVFAAGGFLSDAPCVAPCVWHIHGVFGVLAGEASVAYTDVEISFRGTPDPEDHMLNAIRWRLNQRSVRHDTIPDLHQRYVQLLGGLLTEEEEEGVFEELREANERLFLSEISTVLLNNGELRLVAFEDHRPADGNGTGLSLVAYSSTILDCNANGVVEFGDLACLTDRGHVNTTLDVVGSKPGDLDGDFSVGFSDFLILSASYLEEGGYLDGDIDGNGEVTFDDFLLLSAAYDVVARSESVPEPKVGTMLLGAFVIAFLFRRRVR